MTCQEYFERFVKPANQYSTTLYKWLFFNLVISEKEVAGDNHKFNYI